MNMKIDYISADDGGITMYHADRNGIAGWADTAEGIASVLKDVGLADTVFGSSTMDFAYEEGFADDYAAQDMWDSAINIYNWEVNGVAS